MISQQADLPSQSPWDGGYGVEDTRAKEIWEQAQRTGNDLLPFEL